MKRFVTKALPVLKAFAFYTLLGAFIGSYIGCYQLLVRMLGNLSTALYASRDPLVMLGVFFLMSVLGFVSYGLVLFDRNVDGSGVPNILIHLREDEKVDYKKGLWTVPLSSMLSLFARLTLGSEGPSVALGAKSVSLFNDLFHRSEKNEDVLLGATMGFGAAFLSPFSGLVYYLECNPKALHSLKEILKAIYLSIIIFIFSDLVSPTHLVSIESVPSIGIGFFLAGFLLLLLNVPLSFLFLRGLCAVKAFFARHEKDGVSALRGLLYFPLACLLNYRFFDLMGNGHALFELPFLSYSFQALFLALFARMLFIFLFGTGKASGGLVLPTMSIGILSAEILIRALLPTGLITNAESSLLMMLSITMFFALVSRTPFTGAALFLSILLSAKGGALSLILAAYALLLFLLGNRFLTLFDGEGLYAKFIRIADTNGRLNALAE